MTTTSKTLGVQASLKTAGLEGKMFQYIIQSQTKHGSNLVSPFWEGLIHSIMSWEELYEAKRVSEEDYRIVYFVEVENFLGNPIIKDTPIPRFKRT